MIDVADLVTTWRAEAARSGDPVAAAVLRRVADELAQHVAGERDHPPGVASVATIHGITDFVEIVESEHGYGVVCFPDAPGTQRWVTGPDGTRSRVPTSVTTPVLTWYAALELAARHTAERQDPDAAPTGWSSPPKLVTAAPAHHAHAPDYRPAPPDGP